MGDGSMEESVQRAGAHAGEPVRPLEAGAFRLVRLFGIEVYLHFSVAVIFLLVAGSFGRFLTETHADLPGFAIWGFAVLAALLFLASLLLHELSHSVVARARNVAVESITLFLFGGIAQMTEEPRSPQDEFLIAAAGPAMSIVLGVAFSVLAMALLPLDFMTDGGTEVDFSKLSAPATVCLWLSAVNLALAVFNLLPGFPMDGGRLLRAAIWWRTNDYVLATRRAARMGVYLGWGLIGIAFWQLLSGLFVNGLWMMLIGWFITQLARASATQVILRQTLNNFDVNALMRTRFERVAPDVTVHDFVNNYLLRSSQKLWPVGGDGGDRGVVAMDDIDLSAGGDLNRRVGELMRSLSAEQTLQPATGAEEALATMAGRTAPIAVVDDGRVVGILDHADIMRWLAVHQLLGES